MTEAVFVLCSTVFWGVLSTSVCVACGGGALCSHHPAPAADRRLQRSWRQSPRLPHIHRDLKQCGVQRQRIYSTRHIHPHLPNISPNIHLHASCGTCQHKRAARKLQVLSDSQTTSHKPQTTNHNPLPVSPDILTFLFQLATDGRVCF